MAGQKLNIKGAELWQGALEQPEQEALVETVRDIVRRAPFFHPQTKSGKNMSVRMTAAGSHGWISDRRGYRYETTHPNGEAWPAIPDAILSLWHRFSHSARTPECCLINWYGEGARMGMHQDRDEADFDQPVVSMSLGDDGLFRIGNIERGGKTQSVWLKSGDVVVLSGYARLLHHGVDRIRFGSSALLRNGGRLNLTLRVVT